MDHRSPYRQITKASNAGLAQQYGGTHTAGWVDRLPASWIPYVQLARLSPPAGVFLVFFPHLFGVLNGAIIQEPAISLQRMIAATAQIAGGSFFLSNAIHGWNDLIDAPIDKLVTRTRLRPIVRGAISEQAALIFTLSQAMSSAAFFLTLPPIVVYSATPSIVANFYYPWSKRHIHFAQVVLGFCLAWGTVVGTAAMGVEPWAAALDATSRLTLASVLWTVIYDSIYACQDLSDDVKVGLKSTAILFGDRLKLFLWLVLAAFVYLLITYGQLGQLGFPYYVFTVGGSLVSLGSMVMFVELQSSTSCWWWFRYGFWLTGGAMTTGLLLEYMHHL